MKLQTVAVVHSPVIAQRAIPAAAVVIVLLVAGRLQGAAGEAVNPFGVSSSAQSAGTYTTWMPAATQAGVMWCRMFPEWGNIQPTAGTWNWTPVDSMLNAASNQALKVSGLFFYSAPWVNTNTHTFPMNNLPAWATYVSNLVRHAAGRVSHWEVWNEPQGFAVNGTASNYAQVVIRAYDAAKAADPQAQIGLSVAANDVNYLERTIQAGAAGHFDFVAVHPYEITEALEVGWEPVFMGITRTVRRMLQTNDPARASAPVRFTELGRWSSGSTNDDTNQATTLLKAFTLALAQGVECINWHEAKDGQGGFGLLKGSGSRRPAYLALSNLTAHLGPSPDYRGWVQINTNTDQGFVFQGPATTVMPLWAAPGTSETVTFSATVRVLKPLTGQLTPLPTDNALALSKEPVLILDVPTNLVAQAERNRDLPFPWGGDYTGAASISVTLGAPNTDDGLHQFKPDNSSAPALVYGIWARDASRSTVQDFTVDPNFLSYTPTPIRITVVTRRKEASDSAGFNLKYESPAGWKNYGVWYTVTGTNRWYTNTWTINDPQFVSIWGFNFRLDSDSTNYSKYYLRQVTVTKTVAPPRGPTGLRGTATSSSQTRLSWTDNAFDETGFTIERKTGLGGTYQTIATPGANMTNYSDSGLKPATPYYYRVRADNAGGESASAVSDAIVTPLPHRPTLATPAWSEAAGFAAVLQGQTQTVYRIQWSTDWFNWIDLTNLMMIGTVTPFQDAGDGTARWRFYRAVWP
jgi:polysaccharide biosynthesis protein PslG